ncbi:MAG: cytochrome c biogenesis protein CcsA [Candidatus Omnitrophica bacterium]|nr:cytochrome c biogenesis protein CcsA [Candidatus Omnitrophota bacterium]
MGRVLRCLGSLRIAVPLLVAIAAVLAWGTIYEARFGTAAVQRFIYQSWWFQALLAFLALNLALAALERYPWQRKHLPFVLAHVGIICILLGGIIGGRFGIGGQLIIPEGQAERMLQLPQNVLVVHQPNPGTTQVFPTNFETTAWIHEPRALFRLPHGDRWITLTVDRYYPDAVAQEAVSGDGTADNPAIQLAISHGDQQEQVWLLANDPDRFGMRWGDIHVLFVQPASEQELAAFFGAQARPMQARGVVSIELPDLQVRREIPVPDDFSRPVALDGTPYTLTFKEYFTDLAITEQGVANRSDQPNNPAVAFTLTGPEGVEPFLAFALHPDFEAMHGRRRKIQAHVTYTHAGPPSVPPNSIGVLWHADGVLSCVLTGDRAGDILSGEGVSPRQGGATEGVPRHVAACEAGRRYQHPWLGYAFEIVAGYPRARLSTQVTNRGDEIKAEAVHVTAQNGEQVAEGWIGLHQAIELSLGGAATVRVEYRPAQRELPVTVKLLDFRKTEYPGTQMAASFESDVEVTDPQRGAILMRKISMNNPLRYRGFSFYQSSYAPGPPETTILSVRSDPGTPLVYAGFLIVILGVVSMFVLRKPSVSPLVLLLVLGLFPGAASAGLSAEAIKEARGIAVQHNGRHKPFDSFAWETLKLITGSPRIGREDPVATVCSIMAQPDDWQAKPLIAVPFRPLRERLGMDLKASRISYNDLVASRKLMRMLPAIVQKQQLDEKLTMLEQETMDVYERFVALSALVEQRLALVPPLAQGTQEWLGVFEASGYPQDRQEAMRSAWTSWLASVRGVGSPSAADTSSAAGNVPPRSRGDAEEAARRLAQVLRSANPAAYPASWRLHLEVLYNQLGPFRAARILYLAACILMLLSLNGARSRLGAVGPPAAPSDTPFADPALGGVPGSVGGALLLAAFVVHGAGIAMRVVLGGRPPVSNFYETMLWLPFVAVGLSLVFERFFPARYFGLSASILAAIMLVLADAVPLDSSIAPVVAVLRSNLWLTIHVLTIVASYGALALATILAHLYAWLYLAGRDSSKPALSTLETALYRVMQVGVVLLAGGIMLGAVWANASWGRYWGWDPKETWALITLLWFLALLHGRLAGWLKGIGLAACTIGGFFLLLMTYYGVSFYLVGLHSYAGGHAKPLPLILIAYLIAESAFLIAIGLTALRRSRLKVS